MKKIIIVFCMFILCGCDFIDDENTMDVYESYIGYQDEEEREQLIKENEETNLKTGYSVDGKDAYILGGAETLTMSFLPEKAYTQSIGQVEMTYDRKTEYTVDATINELITTIYDYDTHEVIKTLDIKEILDSSGNYLYVFGCRENEIVEENDELYLIYLVVEKEEDTYTYEDAEIKLLYINIETEKANIREPNEIIQKYKYKKALGCLWNTDFDSVNEDSLNNLRIEGYNYYWQDNNNYSNRCMFRINVDGLNEITRKNLYEKFPTLENDIQENDSNLLTLYLETDEEELLSIFGDKDIYDYSNVELDFRYTKSGKNELVQNSDDMIEKMSEEYILE